DVAATHEIAGYFKTSYLNTVENNDIYGVQYASILKNIYAVGAGLAHGLDYGDNFLSVLIANSADEMAGFLRKVGIKNIEVGTLEHSRTASHLSPEVLNSEEYRSTKFKFQTTNYAASVYLGDLLV